MLSIFVKGRCAYALDFASGKGRLEDVGSIDSALCAAGADQCVKLIDKQDDVFGASDLVYYGFYAFLELSAVFCSGDHHRQVEDDHAFILEKLGHLLIDDLLATGGTVKANIELIEKLGGKIVGIGFLIELGYLEGRKALGDKYEVFSLIKYDNTVG